MIGAKREVLEETGYDVSVHEFLGSMSYTAEGRIKIVQFWLMRADGHAGARTDGRRQSGEMAAVEASHRDTDPAARKSVPHPCRPDRAQSRQEVRAPRNREAGAARCPQRRQAQPQCSAAPVEHVIALDYEKTSPSAFVKALGNWIGRAGAQTAGRLTAGAITPLRASLRGTGCSRATAGRPAKSW